MVIHVEIRDTPNGYGYSVSRKGTGYVPKAKAAEMVGTIARLIAERITDHEVKNG